MLRYICQFGQRLYELRDILHRTWNFYLFFVFMLILGDHSNNGFLSTPNWHYSKLIVILIGKHKMFLNNKMIFSYLIIKDYYQKYID